MRSKCGGNSQILVCMMTAAGMIEVAEGNSLAPTNIRTAPMFEKIYL
jgi:hypothetical protein